MVQFHRQTFLHYIKFILHYIYFTLYFTLCYLFSFHVQLVFFIYIYINVNIITGYEVMTVFAQERFD